MRGQLTACLVIILMGCGGEEREVSGLGWHEDSQISVLAECPEAEVDSACVRVTHRWVDPGTALPQPLADSVRAAIMAVRIAGGFSEEPARSPDELVNALFQSFREVRHDVPDMPAGWFDELDIGVACDSAEFLVLQSDRFWYGGGAHPNTVRHYFRFDRSTGRIIPWDEGIDRASLAPLAEREFRKVRGIAEGASLNGEGWYFTDDRFALPSEGMRCGDRLVLYWNPYEVGPYVMGPTEVEILLP